MLTLSSIDAPGTDLESSPLSYKNLARVVLFISVSSKRERRFRRVVEEDLIFENFTPPVREYRSISRRKRRDRSRAKPQVEARRDLDEAYQHTG